MSAARPRRTVQPGRRYGFSEDSEDDNSQSDSQSDEEAVSSSDDEQVSPVIPPVPLHVDENEWRNVNAGNDDGPLNLQYLNKRRMARP